MKLNYLIINASSDNPLLTPSTYRWSEDDDLGELQSAIEALTRYRDQRLDALNMALASQQPMNPS